MTGVYIRQHIGELAGQPASFWSDLLDIQPADFTAMIWLELMELTHQPTDGDGQ